MEIDNLGSADNLTITAPRLPEGKFSVQSGTSQMDTVILADQVLAGSRRPEARPPPPWTQIELPDQRSRRLRPTTSETCSRRGFVSARFAVTSLRLTETLLHRAVTSSHVSETSLRGP